jgi:hypothetical protein
MGTAKVLPYNERNYIFYSVLSDIMNVWIEASLQQKFFYGIENFHYLF